MKKLLLLSSLLVSLAANAQVEQKVKPEALVSGKQYVLVNKAQTASQYTSRTSWDGALYFLGASDSNWANYALTAVDNGDGTWSFTQPGTKEVETGEVDEDDKPITETVDAPYYLILPAGSANVNMSQDVAAKWKITPPSADGFYQLILGDGNNAAALAQAEYTPTKDLRIHLNNGGQYFVATYASGPWFPDCLGGIEVTEEEATGNVLFAAKDSTSFNWGFVQAENIPAYYADLQYASTINQFYANYCSIDDYSTGFLASYTAAAALYNNAANEDELAEAGITEMLDAKVDLYKAIDKSIAANDDDDATLAAAIATAMNAFDTQTAASTVKGAIETLEEAVKNHALGNGYITSLGKNMSFEDLSAQNNVETSGLAAPPYGWNVYINGTQVTTAEEVGESVKNWHGVNRDCTGDIKEGDYGFGLWTSSVPTYEISQTITGLDNGTYIIKAGLMVGANGSGSRRTTQRIFGNLNSTYFGYAEDYNASLLDNQEVYGFANLTEPTTDTEMQPVEVRAFVYDGTLTFGLRTDGNIAAANRTASNGAGGDGWFKTDNYTILKVGYNADDAIKVYDHYAEILKDYAADNSYMAASAKTLLNTKVSELSKVTKDSGQDDIIAGVLSAKELLATVDTSVKLYEKLDAAIEQHEAYAVQYDSKPGIDDYYDVIDDATDALEDGTAEDAAAIDSIIAALEAALQACIQSDVLEPGVVITDYIKNPSFEDLSAQNNAGSGGVANPPAGWSLYLNGEETTTTAEIGKLVENWCAINEGDPINVELEDGTVLTNQYSDGTHLWGIWTATIPEVELSQTIQGMPAGTYTVTCDVLVQYNWAGYCITTQRIFANDYVAMYSYEDNYENNLPVDAKIAAEIDELNPEATVKHLTYAGHECEAPRSDYSHTVSLTFGLAEQGDIKLGFRTNNIDRDGVAQNSGKGWFKLDNWTLTYTSDEVPAGASTTAEATAISDVQTVKKAAAEFYSVNGVRLAAPQKGINIVRMSDGTVSKVLVK